MSQDSEPTTVAPAAQVFISYASADAAVADQVCAALEAAGVRCWIAPRDVRPGDPYAAAIVAAINNADLLLVILTRAAIESPHVLREIERASSKKRPVISLKLDDAPLNPEFEYFLSSNHWLDASRAGLPGTLPALTTSVLSRLSPAPTGPAAPGTGGAAPPPASRPVKLTAPGPRASNAQWQALAVLVFLLLLFGAWRWFPRGTPAARPATVASSTEPAVATPAPAASAVSDRSIAVLPFTDMSEKHDQEYFSDGMAEEIIDLLVKVPELKVPARTSSFYFKGKSTKIQDIAKELGVANLLEGSVRRSGNHLRVTAQLVRADNGYHLWSESYDRQVDDVFRTQDEIAAAVVKALKVSLLKDEAPRAQPTTSSEAYTLYLQARALETGSGDEQINAYRKLRRAVDLDPRFALAWAEIARLLSIDDADWGQVFDPQRANPNTAAGSMAHWDEIWAKTRQAAREAADKAVAIAPDLADSHRAKATALGWLDWNWAGACAELKIARELSPADLGIVRDSAECALTLGRTDEALVLARRAVELDPLGRAQGTLAAVLEARDDLEGATAARQRVLALYPDVEGIRFSLGVIALRQKNPTAALAAFDAEPAPNWRLTGRPLALDALGRHAEAEAEIASASTAWGAGMAYQISYFYAQRKELDQAFAWLERACRQHDGGLSHLRTDRMLDNLRQDPRFAALLAKVHLNG